MSFNGLFSLVALASAVFAAPSARAPLRELRKVPGETTGRYIVGLKSGVTKADVLGEVSIASVTHEWKTVLNGFAVEGSEETLATLLSSPEVEFVEEDGVVTTLVDTTQDQATWGLARLSSDTALGSTNTNGRFPYTYDESAGEGVDVYIVDTGIFVDHQDFEGRASWGTTFGGYADADGNGHGTHCAGTIGSATYGVAKKANLIAVKVLSDGGSGTFADVISGFNYVAEQAAITGRPSVASVSLGGGASTAVDAAVEAAVASGVHFAVAAGNSNTDARNTSPARAPNANTVGATTIGDARSSFSNYGAVVDIWAPGTLITSTWNTGPTATNTISGTSMATPHIAGLIAYYIGLEGNASPADITAKLQSTALSGVLTGVPSGTKNLLAHIA